jgi:UDP-glucuronate decarboxylase
MHALTGQPITLFGDGKQTRSFCYVSDLVDGLIRLMEAEEDVIGPINLGNPNEFTIRQLAEEVIALTGSGSQIVTKPLPADDPRQRQPDIDLARDKLGWTPKIEFHDGLRNTAAYFRELLNSRPVASTLAAPVANRPCGLTFRDEAKRGWAIV